MVRGKREKEGHGERERVCGDDCRRERILKDQIFKSLTFKRQGQISSKEFILSLIMNHLNVSPFPSHSNLAVSAVSKLVK